MNIQFIAAVETKRIRQLQHDEANSCFS